MMRRLVTSLAIVCALLAFAPAVVAATSGGTPQQAIADCNANQALTKHYSSATLRQALATMPAAIREYSNCYDVIEKQLLAQLGTSSTGAGTTTSSSSGSVLPTWLIIVIVILALAALTFGALAIRRRRLEGPGAPGAPTQGEGKPADPGTPDAGQAPEDPAGPDDPSGSGPAGA
jgi:predicted PurR-regulated permease PerM